MSARSDQVKDHILTSNDQKSPRHAKNKLYAKEIEEMERQYQQQQQHQQRQQQLQGSQRERREYSSNDDEESFLSYDSVPESQQRSQSQSPLQQRKRKMLRINPGKVFRHTKAMMFKTHNRSDDDGDGGCNGDFRDHDNVIPSSHHPSENSHNHNHNHNHNHTNSTPLRRRFSRGDSNKNHKWNSTSNTNPTAIQLHHLHSKEQQQQELQLRSGTASLAPSQRTTTTTGTSSSATTSLYPLPPPNPFTIPPGTKLSPRADLWLLLVLACAVSVGSLADASSPSSSSLFGSGSWNGGGQERSSDEKLALVLSSLAFLISTFVAVAYRYGPTRFHLTRGKGERLVSLGLLALVVAGTGIVMTASGGGGGGTGSGNYGSHGDYIAVTANSIWNTNLFYSQWTVLFTVGYIAGDLLTTENHFGTVSKDYVPTNHIARLWFVFLLAAVSMGGVSSNLVNGPLCQGTYLKQTTLCSNALAAAVLGFLNFVLGLLALGVYRLEVIGGDRMPYYFNVTRLPMKWFDGRANCRRTCHRISSLLASAGLILASVGVALVSAPGGPGTETNSVFVTTWTVFATSFLLVKKHVEEAMGWSPRYDAPSSVPVESVLPGKPLSSSRGGPRRHRHARDGSIRSAASRATTVASNLDECSQDDDYSCEEEEDMVDPFDGMAGGPVDGLHRGHDDDYDDEESGAEDVVGETQEDFHGSDESPFVTTSDAATAVSSLGQSRFTKEPSGVKAGLSHYGGVDAAAGYQNPHPNREQPQGSFSIPNGYNARQPQEAPPEAYGGGGGRMDATGSKLPKQQSFYGGVNASNLYPQQRAWSQDVDSVGCSTQSGTGMMYSHPPPPQQHPQPPPPPPGNPGFYRRNSRTSYASASNLSPLREGSREGSRTSSSSATRTTSTEKGSQSSRSRSRSSSNQRGGRRVPPPPIDSNRYLNPHPPSVSTVDTESLPMTDDGELSASRGPSTVDNSRQSPARSRPPPPSSRRLDEHIRATSMDNNQASDFDILISESSTVVTELTNDGFDAGATPSSSRGFPPSNPLYNISRGGRNGAGSGSGSGGYQDPTSPVDELVASALAHARRSRNHDSGTAEIFTDDEESHLGGGGGGGVTYHGGGISSGRSNSRPKSRERKERRQTPNTTHSSGGKKRGSGKTKRQHPQHPGRANNFGDSNQSAAAASTSTSKSGKGCRNHRGSIQSNFSSLMNDFPPDEMGDYVC